MDIKILKEIELSKPAMIAGWPGMGSVALGAVDYIQQKLGAKKIAEIVLNPLTTLDSVVVENGLAKLPEPPKSAFYYTKSPDLLIFQGEAQLTGLQGIDLVKQVIGFAAKHKVSCIYTAAAFPLPVSHKEPPKIYGAANKKQVLTSLSKLGVEPMEDGHVAGLNGLIVGLAHQVAIDAVCLLATMPQYAISLPNPKASGAIVSVLRDILGFKIDMRGIDDSAREMDEKMSVIEEKVKDVLVENVQTNPGHDIAKVPGYIIDKIENMFSEAMRDRSKGLELKKELDRWDLYKHYEDRFLDLFRDTKS